MIGICSAYQLVKRLFCGRYIKRETSRCFCRFRRKTINLFDSVRIFFSVFLYFPSIKKLCISSEFICRFRHGKTKKKISKKIPVFHNFVLYRSIEHILNAFSIEMLARMNLGNFCSSTCAHLHWLNDGVFKSSVKMLTTEDSNSTEAAMQCNL